MTVSMQLVLEEPESPVGRRIRYAFGAYAALYGVDVVDGGPSDLVVTYGGAPDPGTGSGRPPLALPALYRVRPASRPAPAPRWIDGLPSFHHAGETVDILGEVVEWLAAPHERACPTDALDAVGRVPPHQDLAGSHGLDRTVPWVNRWLARLHTAVRRRLPRLPLAPRSPFPSPFTFVASHDLDHLSASTSVNLRRVAENVGVALLHRRDRRTASQIVGAAVKRSAGGLPLADGVAEVLAGEALRGVRATYTVVPTSTHARDPGYRLDDAYVRHVLDAVDRGGHEIAVHGSYRSLEAPGRLTSEYGKLGDVLGAAPSGGRQHWLRYRGAELFHELCEAGATWDSTAGHPDEIGYRHGAAFPFPPYDLDAEQAFPIIEIPLVVMERALCSSGRDPVSWSTTALDVLRRAGPEGWGGVAVLWHDSAFTGTALPAGLAECYWDLLDAGDRWVTATEVAEVAWSRWNAAGVLDPVSGRDNHRESR